MSFVDQGNNIINWARLLNIFTMKIRDKVTKTLLSPLVILLLINKADSLNSRHVDQKQRIQSIFGDSEEDLGSLRGKRDTGQVEGQGRLIQDKAVSSAFNLHNSHLHLMVHWAGKGSSIVFCLARDQVRTQRSSFK